MAPFGRLGPVSLASTRPFAAAGRAMSAIPAAVRDTIRIRLMVISSRPSPYLHRRRHPGSRHSSHGLGDPKRLGLGAVALQPQGDLTSAPHEGVPCEADALEERPSVCIEKGDLVGLARDP